MIYLLDKRNTKTQNISCCVNENSTTFLYTLNRGDKKIEGEKRFSYLKCTTKSNVLLKIWVLVFSIRIWYLAYPTDRSLNSKIGSQSAS